jgi:2-phosphosulfolactate phosphatase
MTKIHVLLKKDELDSVRLSDKVVVVLDVLFATTTIISALAHGAHAVLPAESEAGARAAAAALTNNGRLSAPPVLAGEWYAETIPGFASPTPLALMASGIRDRTVIYSTTNGTVALKKAQAAPAVYAGALINGTAVVERVLKAHPGETIIIVCSGSVDNFNLEDFYGAGYLVALLSERLGQRCDLTDAALAAKALFDPRRARELLLSSRVGRMMIERDLVPEVEFAAKLSSTSVVPSLTDGMLRPV